MWWWVDVGEMWCCGAWRVGGVVLVGSCDGACGSVVPVVEEVQYQYCGTTQVWYPVHSSTPREVRQSYCLRQPPYSELGEVGGVAFRISPPPSYRTIACYSYETCETILKVVSLV